MALTENMTGEVIGGNYRVLRRLGKGGMAEVFLARQEGLAGVRKMVVIKRLLPQYTEVQDVAEMLLDEARVAAQLSHPNVVQIFELGQEKGAYFIAMEFVDGCDLATLARIERHRHSRVPLRITLRVLAEAALGLDYAHRQIGIEDSRPLNVVHRDVSPHNVLCSREGLVKLTDFGISKFVGKTHLTQVGVVKGKVQYMSPEQYRGGAIDHRADIFSIGVVLYQLTTGKLPRVDENGQLDIRRVTEGNIPRPSEVREDYPEDLEAIVMRALAHNPDERYSDAASLRDDLLEFAREHDLLAFPRDLGQYVNELVPPLPRRQDSSSTASPTSPSLRGSAPGPLPGPPDGGSDLPQGAPEVTGPIYVGMEVKRGLEELDSAEYHKATDIPINTLDIVSSLDDSLADGSGRDDEPAVLPEEEWTPLPEELESDPGVDHERDLLAAEPSAPRIPVAAPSAIPAATQDLPTTRLPRPDYRLDTTPTRTARTSPQGRAANLPATIVAVGALLLALGALAMVVARNGVLSGDREQPTTTSQPAATPPASVPKPRPPAEKRGETPRPPAAQNPKPLKTGVVEVYASPAEATVHLAGKKRCASTPCQVAGLALGRELELRLESPGHDPWVQQVLLTPDSPKMSLRAQLTPSTGARPARTAPRTAPKRPAAKPKPAAAAPTRTPPGSAPQKPSAAAKPAPAPAAAPGPAPKPAPPAKRTPAQKAPVRAYNVSDAPNGKTYLTVDVQPWAEVLLDGKVLGHTPLKRAIKPGRHAVELRNAQANYRKRFMLIFDRGTTSKLMDAIQ